MADICTCDGQPSKSSLHKVMTTSVVCGLKGQTKVAVGNKVVVDFDFCLFFTSHPESERIPFYLVFASFRIKIK